MKLKIINSLDNIRVDMFFLPVFGKEFIKEIDKMFNGTAKVLKSKKFEGNPGEKLIHSIPELNGTPVIFVGAGKVSGPDTYRNLASVILKLIKEYKVKKSVLIMKREKGFGSLNISNFLDYLLLNSYTFNKYISGKDTFNPEKIFIYTENKKEFVKVLKESEKVVGIVEKTRDLVNEIPAKVTPKFIKSLAKKLSVNENITLRIYEGKALEKEKLNGLLSVGKGSVNKPALVKVTYSPKNYKKTVAIVGKGITYDSGGLNIKTGSYMSDMKSDMSGTAAVLGVIELMSILKSPVKIISFLPLAENMPSGESYKPDDIIIFGNNKSVEIKNTDAEGRLVLADAIIMASKEKPDYIVELSTLTGAIISALGDSFAGLFTSDDSLSGKLIEAGEKSGEFLWRMPMYKSYKKSIKSKIADLKNADYGTASSIKAGLFLNEFTDSVPFAHIDIAGTAFINEETGYNSVIGATGFGVRLLYYFLKTL